MNPRFMVAALGLLAAFGCVEVQRTMRGEAAAGDREPDWGPVAGNDKDADNESEGEAQDADADDEVADDANANVADEGQNQADEEVGPEPSEADADDQEQEETDAEQAPAEPPELSDDLEEVTTETGLRYIDIEEGTGTQPEPGDSIEAHYTGWLEDGTKFDSSLDRGDPITFTLEVSSVIQGWHEGLANMREGGRRRLIIPPELGYGESRNGPIPPNATLIFDVELLAVNPQ